MTIDRPDKSQIPALRALWNEAFGDTDEFLDIFFHTAFSADRCRCVSVNRETAAALYWFDCLHENRKIAYIYAVATARSHRGQGLCGKLMADTHAHLENAGYAGAILVPGSGSLFDFYGRMGYETCSYVREFTCGRSDEAIKIERIGREEYTAVRRTMLPSGGVIQEGENIDFLCTQAELYRGEDFVLAARCENGILHGTEILGSISSAPKIVNALGCRTGKFRTTADSPAGQERPFAMYKHFGGGTRTPSGYCSPGYFGLAFD